MMFNFFNKKKQEKKVIQKKADDKKAPFDLNNFIDDKQELFKKSVQRTPKDFKISSSNVAMDGIGDSYSVKNLDNNSFYAPDYNLGQEIIFSYFAKNGFIGFNNCAILAQDWLINKALSVPCEEAIAVSYDLTLKGEEIDPEDTTLIEELKNKSEKNNKFNINQVCKEFAINKRKYGQALCIPIVEDADYSVPFNIDSISSKSYKGMSVIEPMWVAPVLDEEASSDPTSSRFYKPTWFRMPNGKEVHYTWFIFNTYGIVSDLLKPTYYFGGLPLPQLLYEQTYASHKTAKEAPMLAQSKRLNYMEGNLNAYLTDEEKLRKDITLVSWLRNNWGWLFIKKDQQIGQLDTSLTDFDAVTMLGYQIVSAISGVPSTKLLETSPKGWQSNGSYEGNNYKMLLQSIQRDDFCPILDFHYKLLCKSENDIVKDFATIFAPVDTPTEKERAEIRELNSRTDMNYINAGVISPDEVRNVIREDINSGYNALSEEMEGEPNEQDPFNDILGGNSTEQAPFNLDEWEESKHPRKENGQFGKGSGNGEKKSDNKDIKALLGEEIKGVKGQEAINALLEKKSGHVKSAFSRKDTGDIDLIWGDKGKGLCHIIERRKEQGIDTKSFLNDLGDVIEKGQLVRTNEKGRYEIFYNGKMAIIEPELTNGKLTFLLTAYKRRKP